MIEHGKETRLKRQTTAGSWKDMWEVPSKLLVDFTPSIFRCQNFHDGQLWPFGAVGPFTLDHEIFVEGIKTSLWRKLEQLELSLELSHKTQAQTNAIKCTRNLHVSQVSQRPSWTRLDKKPRHFALWNEASSAILPVSTLVTPAVNPMQTLILAINISSIQYIYIYCIYTYCIYTYYTYVYILYIILYIFTIYIYISIYFGALECHGSHQNPKIQIDQHVRPQDAAGTILTQALL